jgi:hypothetical protein
MGLEFDSAVDIFALGATLYEAALGVPAFGGDEQVALRKIVAGELADPRQVRADFPVQLWKVLEQMLCSKPEERPRSAQLARSLDSAAGLTQAQGRALLSSAMRRLFPDELGAESTDIAELRRLSRPEGEATAQGHVVSRVTRQPVRSRSSVVGWTAALSLVAGGVALFALTRQPAAVPSSGLSSGIAEPSPNVEVAVRVTPAGLPGLQISIGGVPVPAQTPLRVLPRGTQPLEVMVRAPGYQSVELNLLPDRDRSVGVTLVPAPAAASAAAPRGPAPARAPAAAPSGVIRRYPF